MKFSISCPFNSLSLSQTSLPILKEMYKEGLSPSIFPIGGNVDLSAYEISEDFDLWLKSAMSKSLKNYKRNDPHFRLWHLNGSHESVSNKQTLLTFYELDQPTDTELNIATNQQTLLVTSRHTKQVFEDNGATNVKYVPLGFDSSTYKVLNKKYYPDDVISFGLSGKMEKRKCTARLINLWVKKYGNNRRYMLNCLVFNPFLNQDVNNQFIAQALGGEKPFNVNFLPILKTNKEVNEFHNCLDIDISGISGAEGWNFSPFLSMCMGKLPICGNCSSMKDWSNEERAVMIEPNGKESAVDNIFFHQNQPFNQGNIFTYSDEAILESFEKAVKRVEQNKINQKGLEAASEYTWEKTTKIILDNL